MLFVLGISRNAEVRSQSKRKHRGLLQFNQVEIIKSVNLILQPPSHFVSQNIDIQLSLRRHIINPANEYNFKPALCNSF